MYVLMRLLSSHSVRIFVKFQLLVGNRSHRVPARCLLHSKVSVSQLKRVASYTMSKNLVIVTFPLRASYAGTV